MGPDTVGLHGTSRRAITSTDKRNRSRQALLLKLVRRDPTTLLDAQEVAMLTDSALQRDFFSVATRHGVQGLILSVLSSAPSSQHVPHDLPGRARGSLERLRAAAVFWDLERDRLASHLDARGLTPVMLKGAALRHTAYSDPAQRPVTDIDVLVAPSQLLDAVEALQAIGYRSPGPDGAVEGYRQHHFHIRLSNQNGFVVELHWGLIRPGRPFELDPVAFLSRAVLHRRAPGPDIRVPSHEDMIGHLACQNAEGFFKLGRLVDIDRVVAAAPDLDWDYVRRAAQAGKLEIALAISLQLCRTLLDTPVPQELTRWLGVPFGCQVHLALLRPGRWPLMPSPERVVETQLRTFWSLTDWRPRLRLVRHTVGGSEDPLKWLWEGQAERAPEPTSLSRGVASLIKLAAYQVALYIRGAIAALAPSGRAVLRFWS